jgi:hypothetical protein
MTTPGMFQSKRGPVGLVLTGCALTGIVLMGVPCGSSKTSSPTVNPKAPAVPVTGSFVPSNARVDDSISASEATTLTLEGIDGAFVFVGGQQWLDYEDGTARLIAELSDAGDRNRRFELSLQASVRRFPADLGGADFNLALDPSAYKDQGGMIDPDLLAGSPVPSRAGLTSPVRTSRSSSSPTPFSNSARVRTASTLTTVRQPVFCGTARAERTSRPEALPLFHSRSRQTRFPVPPRRSPRSHFTVAATCTPSRSPASPSAWSSPLAAG